MAQNIQLKRSALPGKVPDTGSLNLGELAVNTYDGKVFIKRSGSIESIQELITTNATNTGSITLTQTGSFGELVVTQDANIQNDLYVTNDIIANGDLDILGNITGSNLLIKGTLTAQSYIVSSSVVNMTTQFASGSTIFGNTSDDTHQFTGSVQISGSLNVIGGITGSIAATNGVISGSSQISALGYATTGSNIFTGTQYINAINANLATAPTIPSIGDNFQGGRVAYILQSGDSGYDINYTKGLITSNTSTPYTTWGCSGTLIAGTSDAIGTGQANSNLIIAGGCSVAGTAINFVDTLTTASFSDWYLPSYNELQQIYNNRASLGIPTNITYWSSTDYSTDYAKGLNFAFGSFALGLKSITAASAVAVRSFSIYNPTKLTISGSTIITGSLSVNGGITGSIAATNGVVSGSSQLTSSYDARYVLSGSITQTTWDNIASKPGGIVSGSSQLTSSYDARYALSGTIGSQFYKKVETFTATAGQVTFTTAALMSAGNVDVFVNGAKLPPDEFTITSTNTLNLTNAALAGELIDIEMFSAFGGTIGYFELTGIPQGIISGSQQLTSSYDTRYTLSGSVQSLPDGLISGSSQLTSSYDTRYTLSGSVQPLPNGLISGSSQLTSSYDTRYVISGSITQTTWDNIASKPGGIVSGSSQLTSSYDTRYALSGSAGSTEFYKTTQIFTASAAQTSFTIGATATAGNVDVFVNGVKLVETDFTIPSSHIITLATASVAGQIVNIETFNTYAVTTTAQGGGKIHTQAVAASTWTFAHNLGAQYPNVTVYNSSNQIIIPSSITANSTNLMTLEFGTPVAGYAAVSIGGVIDAEGKTSKQQFTSSLEWRFEHNLGDRFIAIQTFNNSYEMIVPQNITLTDVTSSTITFPTPVAGWAVGTIGGGLPAISSSNAGNYLRVSQTAPYTASWIPAVDITVANAITASHLNPISQSLVPAFSGTYDLGSVSKPWRHIYVGTGSIYLVDDTATITKAITANTIVTTTDIASGSINLASSLPSGIVSHSAQLNNTTIANLTITNLTTVNQTASVVFSSGSNRFGDFGNDTHQFTGSVQISGSITTLGSSTATSFSGAIAATNGVVSGSSQITFSGISSLPTLVSGSSQITYANISSIPAGIVSGSSQITYASVSSIPAGIVSGSSQITLSSTTGYGSVLNQALLTSSSPTFAGLSVNGNINITGTNKIVFNNEPLSWFLQVRTTASTANLGSGLKNLIYNGGGASEGIAFSGVDTGAASMEVRNDGRVWIKENLTVGGTLTENSSLRYKENVETIKYGLDKVLQMRGVTYDKKNTGVKEIGVVAEEVYDVLPEVVLKNEEGEIDSVSYGRITAVLIEAIKEQQKQIEELKALIK